MIQERYQNKVSFLQHESNILIVVTFCSIILIALIGPSSGSKSFISIHLLVQVNEKIIETLFNVKLSQCSLIGINVDTKDNR